MMPESTSKIRSGLVPTTSLAGIWVISAILVTPYTQFSNAQTFTPIDGTSDQVLNQDVIKAKTASALITDADQLLDLDNRRLAADSVAIWLTSSDKYKSLTPDELVRITKPLAHSGSEATTASTRLTSHIADVYLADEQATKALTSNDWHQITTYLADQLTVKQKLEWSEQIRSAFINSNDDDLENVTRALNALGDTTHPNPVTTLVLNHERWRSWSPDRLASLAPLLDERYEPALWESESAKREVVDVFQDTYLNDPNLGISMGPNDWLTLVSSIHSVLSHNERSLWAAKLSEISSSNGWATTNSDTETAHAYMQAISYLDPDAAASTAISWIRSSDQLSESSAINLSAIGLISSRASDQIALSIEALNTIDQAILNQPGEVDLQATMNIAEAWSNVREYARAKQWVARAHENTHESASDPQLTRSELIQLSRLIRQFGGVENNESSATALVVAIRHGEPVVKSRLDTEEYGFWLSDPESLIVMQEAVIADDLSPLYELSQVISWSALANGSESQWLTFLDEQVDKSDGDTKADWLAARGFARSVSVGAESFRSALPHDLVDRDLRDALPTKPWLDRDAGLEDLNLAVNTAVSDTGRARAITRLGEFYIAMEDEQDGLAAISMISEGLNSPAVVETIEAQDHLLRDSKFIRLESEASDFRHRALRYELQAEAATEQGEQALADDLLSKATINRNYADVLRDRIND